MSADPPRPGDEPARLAALANRLFHAARTGDVALLEEAMAGGAPPDLVNQNGDSLVMLAAYHGHTAAVAVLLDAGASPDLLNDRGQTPLAGAVFKGYAAVAEVLLAAGADPQAGAPTAYAAAVMFDRGDILSLFDAHRGRTGS
jgi:hypothetical protein